MLKFTLAVIIVVVVVLASSISLVAAVPKGFMTFFDATACPAGWQEFKESQGRLIVSVTDAENAGITVGVPLADREDRKHTHPTTLSATLPQHDVSGAGGGNHNGAHHGQVSMKTTAHNASSGLPFTQLLLCEKMTPEAQGELTAIGTFGFFAPSVQACPAGWKAKHDLQGRIAVGGFDEGGGISNAAASLTSGEVRKHSHVNLDIPVEEQDTDYIGIGGCCDSGPSRYENVLDMRGTAEEASNDLPYIQLLTCASEQRSFNLSFPANALVFQEAGCAPGWSIALEVAGRMLVSLPHNGVPGAFFGGESFNQTHPSEATHRHFINGAVEFPSVGIELGTGCCAHGYTKAGTFNAIGRTTNGDVDMPFSEFPMCKHSGSAPVPNLHDGSSRTSPLSLFGRKRHH